MTPFGPPIQINYYHLSFIFFGDPFIFADNVRPLCQNKKSFKIISGMTQVKRINFQGMISIVMMRLDTQAEFSNQVNVYIFEKSR